MKRYTKRHRTRPPSRRQIEQQAAQVPALKSAAASLADGLQKSELSCLRLLRDLNDARERLSKLSQDVLRYCRVDYYPSETLLLEPRKIWEWDGSFAIQMRVSMNHVQQIPRAHMEDWRKHVISEFARLAAMHADKTIRIMER